ncbi:integrase core domain-containing protein [Mycobacterium sp. 852002-40037_SCH5390672]|uniref:integrase core domain-containing protein n=1 Tax=Mycobacterium sp. 852002-40037_SCH5390672 TaxID=1834089 RepID=UPI0012E91138
MAQAVNDWSRFNSAGSLFIDPGSPWRMPGSNHSTASCATNCSTHGASTRRCGARVIIEDWRCDYNANQPHSAHGDLTPTEFALQWTKTHQTNPHSDWTTERVCLTEGKRRDLLSNKTQPDGRGGVSARIVNADNYFQRILGDAAKLNFMSVGRPEVPLRWRRLSASGRPCGR